MSFTSTTALHHLHNGVLHQETSTDGDIMIQKLNSSTFPIQHSNDIMNMNTTDDNDDDDQLNRSTETTTTASDTCRYPSDSSVKGVEYCSSSFDCDDLEPNHMFDKRHSNKHHHGHHHHHRQDDDGNAMTESDDDEEPDEGYTLYPRRWMVLFSFAVMAFSSSWIWMSFSPLASAMAHSWHVPTNAINDLAAIYLYVHVLMSVPSLYLVVNHLGLHRGQLLGALLNAAGAAMRYQYADNYSRVYLGTVIVAWGQTFCSCAPCLIASSWFGANEKVMATSLGQLAHQLGAAAGLGVTILVDFTTNNSPAASYPHIGDLSNSAEMVDLNILERYLGAQLVMACAAILLIALFGGNEPPTPPNRAAHISRIQRASAIEFDTAGEFTSIFDEESSLLLGDAERFGYQSCVEEDVSAVSLPSVGCADSMDAVCGKWTNIVYIVSYGLPMGVLYALPIFVGQFLTFDRYGTESYVSWSAAAIGWAGLIFQASGIAGSFIALRLTHNPEEYRSSWTGLLGGGVISLLIFLLATTSSTSSSNPESTLYLYYGQSTASVSIAIVFGLMGCGLCLTAAKTAGLKLGYSLMFAADDVVLGPTLEWSAQLWGFLLVTAGTWMMDSVDYEYGDGRICFLGALAAAVAFSMVVTVLWQPSRTKWPVRQ